MDRRGRGEELGSPLSSSSPISIEIFGLENDPALANDPGDRISSVVTLWVPDAVRGRESHSHDGPGTVMRLCSELLGPADWCAREPPSASTATFRLSMAWKALKRTSVSAMTCMYFEHHPIMTISFLPILNTANCCVGVIVGVAGEGRWCSGEMGEEEPCILGRAFAAGIMRQQ